MTRWTAEKRDRMFWSHVDVGDCWLWTGATHRLGYGAYSHGMAHHVDQILVGEIPEGLELDHLCRVRNCVNPDHLEPVTHAENMRRAGRFHRPECKNGHPRTPENSRLDERGWRTDCKPCTRERARRQYERIKSSNPTASTQEHAA